MSVVYFIQAGASGPIKIGTARNLGHRIRSLQCGCPEPLVVLATMIGDSATERWLHDFLGACRHRGEWFAPTADVLRAADCAKAGRLPDWPAPEHRVRRADSIADFVKVVREHLQKPGVRKGALAEAAGLHPNTLLGAGRPSWNPTAETLRKLETVLSRGSDDEPEQVAA